MEYLNTISQDWAAILESEFQKDYYHKLMANLEQEYRYKSVFPERKHIFSALEATPYQRVKVVLLGQDPYHGPGQAHGMSFSVRPGIKPPPSLKNMFKELYEDIGCTHVDHGYLISWAEQGVLLLNTILTVREGEPGSHKGIGWEKLTDHIIQALNAREKPLIFVLWGSHAQKKARWVNHDHHKVIASAHPSPLSAYRGFFGSRPYSRINKQLLEWGQRPIDWQLAKDVEKSARTGERGGDL